MSLLVQHFPNEESTNILPVPSIMASSMPVSWNRSSSEHPTAKNSPPPTCTKCGKPMRFMLVKTGGRKFRCIDCDIPNLVCAENLSSGVVVVKSAKDGV